MAPRTLFQPKPYAFPVLFGSHELPDYVLTGSIPLELWLKHEGHLIKEKGTAYHMRFPTDSSHPSDTLIATITTYRGMSLGATHYYGKLNLPRVRFQREDTNNWAFWLTEKTMLQEIQLNRRIHAPELKADHENTYRGCKPGDWTYKFNTIGDVTNRAINITRFHFPGFKLIQNYEGQQTILTVPPLPTGDTTRKPNPRQGTFF